MKRKGKSNKVVVEDLIKNLNQFVSLVENEFIDIKKEKDYLSTVWKDGQYDDFSYFIDELVKKLQVETTVLQGEIDRLERKVKLY